MKRAIILLAVMAASIANGQMFAQMFSATSKARLPDEYQEVEYLQVTTAGPRIETGVVPSLYGTDFEIKLSMPAVEGRLFGVVEDISGDKRFRLYMGTSWTLQFAVGTMFHSPGVLTNTVATLKYSSKVMSVNGSTTYTYSGADVQFTTTVCLFAANEKGTAQTGLSTVYYCKLWQSSTLVRDYVPAVRKSDSVAGMYDIVNSTFTVNAGTGSFTVGPDVN